MHVAFQAVAQGEQRVRKPNVINIHAYAPALLQSDFLVSQSTEESQNSQFLQPLLLCKCLDSTSYSKEKEC